MGSGYTSPPNAPGRARYGKCRRREATQVTFGGAYEGRTPDDGRPFVSARALPAVAARSGPCPRAGRGKSQCQNWRSCEDQPFWGVLKQGTYFIAKENEPREAVCFFSCGAREVAAHVVRLDKEPDWAFLGLAMSVDGRSLLTVQIDREANDLMMIENFR
jgi:hypothetical protein